MKIGIFREINNIFNRCNGIYLKFTEIGYIKICKLYFEEIFRGIK